MGSEVTVVMPSYNTAPYIADAILSVQNQTHSDWKLFIVDDGSSDATDKIVEPFLSDSRILYFKRKNGGSSQARNTALQKVESEFVGFLDSDDRWHPEKLNFHLKVLKSRD